MNYTADYSHCNNDDCKLKNRCYRYFLHNKAKEMKLEYVLYTVYKTENNERCNYFIDNERHKTK